MPKRIVAMPWHRQFRKFCCPDISEDTQGSRRRFVSGKLCGGGLSGGRSHHRYRASEGRIKCPYLVNFAAAASWEEEAAAGIGHLKGGSNVRYSQSLQRWPQGRKKPPLLPNIPGEDRVFEFVFCGLAMRAVSYVHRNRMDHATVQAQIGQLGTA